MSMDVATSHAPGNGLLSGFDSSAVPGSLSFEPRISMNGTGLSSALGNGNGNGNGVAGARPAVSTEMTRALAEVKGQSQFLLYLADQIEESLGQLSAEDEECQAAFLCKVLSMYAAQLESKHRCVGEKITQTCGQVYSTVRDFESR